MSSDSPPHRGLWPSSRPSNPTKCNTEKANAGPADVAFSIAQVMDERGHEDSTRRAQGTKRKDFGDRKDRKGLRTQRRARKEEVANSRHVSGLSCFS